MTRRNPSAGRHHADQLRGIIRNLEQAPRDGSREIPTLTGLVSANRHAFIGTPDNTVSQLIGILADTRLVYKHGDSVVLNRENAGQDAITIIATPEGAEPIASPLLANYVVCTANDEQFAPPRWLLTQMFASDLLRNRLPRLQYYASRPVFGPGFEPLSRGWHPDLGMLVHGPHVEPTIHPNPDLTLPPIRRLPPLLSQLLRGFCFAEPADLANTLAALLTGVLSNHFMDDDRPKPIFLVNGNQPGLGKSLLACTISAVLDGVAPLMTPYTSNDEELQKRLGAQLRDAADRSVILLDNSRPAADAAIASPLLEALTMSATCPFRLLGHSAMFNVPNRFVWMITMNSTRVNPDIMSRSVPIQLMYEGPPERREFAGPDPVRFARENRVGLLGELFGMVVRWTQSGQVTGVTRHRCHVWSGIVGGVVAHAGFPEILANLATAAEEFNTAQEELAALAIAAVRADGLVPSAATAAGGTATTARRLPSDWVPLFTQAGVLSRELRDNPKEHAKAVRVGQFLNANIGRPVRIETADRSGQGTLRVAGRRSRQTWYVIEVVWEQPDGTAVPGGAPSLAVEPDGEPTRDDSPPPPPPAGGNDLDWV